MTKTASVSTFISWPSFYARQHIIARICYRPSVCLSVRLSDGWIIQKRLKIWLWNFHHTVALSL